jgi:hypothetical protein
MAAENCYDEFPNAAELTAEIETLQGEINFLKYKIGNLIGKSKDYRGMIREMHEKAVELNGLILKIGTDDAVSVGELLKLVRHIIGCAWYGDNNPTK